METKVCTKCKKEFPKTTDFFYGKVVKQKNKKGISIYYLLRAMCKSCNNEHTEKNRIKKRCLELGCSIDEYEEYWRKDLYQKLKKNPNIHGLGLSSGQINVLNKKIKNGYKFTTVEQYKLDCRANVSKCRRKYNYGDISFVTTKQINQKRIENISDSYIANSMGLPVSEVPKEILTTKRLIIKLKRELKK